MNKVIVYIVIAVIVLVAGYGAFNIISNTTDPNWPPPSPQSSDQTDQIVATSTVEGTPSDQTATTSATQTPVVKENIVTSTSAGYSPLTLTIKKGDTVTFKNESSKPVWTASAVHPTHKVYPTTGGCLGSTFDACVGIKSGESWSFKFDIAGTWKYHDHLNAKNFGAIVVE
jgi:plastocyanin